MWRKWVIAMPWHGEPETHKHKRRPPTKTDLDNSSRWDSGHRTCENDDYSYVFSMHGSVGEGSFFPTQMLVVRSTAIATISKCTWAKTLNPQVAPDGHQGVDKITVWRALSTRGRKALYKWENISFYSWRIYTAFALYTFKTMISISLILLSSFFYLILLVCFYFHKTWRLG